MGYLGRKKREAWLSILMSLFLFPIHAQAIPAEIGIAPDNNLGVLLRVIDRARSSLTINIYQFEHPDILARLKTALKRGVTIRLLIEGSPVRGMTRGGWATLSELKSAMQAAPSRKQNRLIIMRKQTEAKRRYRWNHAKYVIADHSWIWVGSENFTLSGHSRPAPNGQSTVGNRGWTVAIKSPADAAQLERVFDQDTQPGFADLEEPASISLPAAVPASPQRVAPVRGATFPPLATEIRLNSWITAPGADAPLAASIRSAKLRIDTEQMSMPSIWKMPAPHLNPIALEWIAAAQQGKPVRALLNDDRVFEVSGDPEDPDIEEKRKNWGTARYLAQLKRCNGLPIEGRIVDINRLEITYIHNKGYLIDDDQVIVSSINGTQNSMLNNRELAVAFTSRAANAHLRGAFEWDWARSISVLKEPQDCSRIGPRWQGTRALEFLKESFGY